MTADLEKFLHELRLQIKSDMNINLNKQEERITSKINQNIDQKFTHIHNEIEKIKQTNEYQEKRISLIEKQIRAKNIIFFGIEEDEKSYGGLEEKILTTTSMMGVNCTKNELEIVRRMGRPSEGKTRPVSVTLTTFGKKLSILKNKNKLGNTSIYLKEDFPPQVLEARKSLQAQLQKERSEGKLAYLKYDKLVVRGRITKRDENSTQIQNSKKRELVITPPHSGENPSSSNSEYTKKHRTAKKNKTTRYGQGSIINFVQRRDDTPQPATGDPDHDDIDQ